MSQPTTIKKMKQAGDELSQAQVKKEVVIEAGS